MYLARILYPVEVLGCGKRVGIWFNGCPHHCKGCSNPELWEFQKRYSIRIENGMQLINRIAKENLIDCRRTRSLYMGNRISHFHLSGRFYSGKIRYPYIAGRELFSRNHIQFSKHLSHRPHTLFRSQRILPYRRFLFVRYKF